MTTLFFISSPDFYFQKIMLITKMSQNIIGFMIINLLDNFCEFTRLVFETLT